MQTYLACLLALARADRRVEPQERDFVERQAALLGVEPSDLWTVPPVDQLLQDARELPLRTRGALVRDLVFLARADGHYAREERREIERIATRLGIPPVQVAMLEAQAAVPQEVDGAPGWFREYWYLAQKG